MFDDAFSSGRLNGSHVSFPVDIHETSDELIVRADMPGIKLEDISVQVQASELTIRAVAQLLTHDVAVLMRRLGAALSP